MILSNIEILNGVHNKWFDISPLAGHSPTESPFNTSSVDLRLSPEIMIPTNENAPVQLDLTKPNIAPFLAKHSHSCKLSKVQPYTLERNKFILGQTIEKVSFPLNEKEPCFSARVEGRSSLARCGILIHFTAPTIHAGFSGPITLEIINLGPLEFLLKPEMFICQLIIEEVKGVPIYAPNQFSGQKTPAGT